ncbi:MAG: hypothetical protein WKF48_00335 [Solirubrobacteraceae bacterium]
MSGQLAAKRRAGTVQAALERRLAQPKDGSGLRCRKPLHVAQHERRPVIEGKRAYRAIQLTAQLVLLGAGLGALRVVGELVATVFFERCDDLAAPTPVAAAAGFVDADPVQPGEELGVAAEAGQPSPGAQERLLDDLLGLVRARAQMHDGTI